MKEIGSVGKSTSALFTYNLATDEYLSTLKWPYDIEIYNKMERSDAQVKAMLLLLELPIRSTSWFVKPKDASSKAKEIALFVEDALFTGPPTGMKTTFDELIKNACTMFTYGHSVLEKVYEAKNGYVKWQKFAVRPQSTLYDWIYDDVGDLTAIQQWNLSKGWQIVEIPLDKLLIFTHDKQQGDSRGRSVLRAAYKHHSIKDFLYKISNVGIERNFVGTPVIQLPMSYSETDLQQATDIVQNLRSSEYGGVVLPNGMVLDLFEGKRTLMDVLPYIEHQDVEISRSILAQFINLGGAKGSGGSYALSSNQSDMFLMMLNASAKNIASTINSFAIPEIVQYNFDSDLFPTLTFKPLGGEKIVEVLKTLCDGGIVTPDKDLEAYLRDMLDLPEKSKESYADTALKQSQEMAATQEVKETEETVEEEDVAEVKETEDEEVEKKLAETSLPKNFQAVNDAFDSLEDEFMMSTKLITRKMLSELSTDVVTIPLEGLGQIQMKHVEELSDAIFKVYKKAFQSGVNQVNNELGQNSKVEADLNFLKAKADVTAENIAQRIKTRFLSEFLKSFDEGITAERLSQAVLGSLIK